MLPARTALGLQTALWAGSGSICWETQHHLTPVIYRLLSLRDLKTQANEVRIGNVLEFEGELLAVTKASHTTGRGRQLGNVQLEMRSLKTGRKHSVRQRPYDTVEVAQLRSNSFQYLYAEDDELHLMNMDHFSQISVPRSLFGEQARWLADGMQVTVTALPDGQPVTGRVPATVTLRVVEAEPSRKGDRVSPTSKACTLENGCSVLVPGYVQTGQQIVVDTHTGEFLKRVS